jgi:hypothetical protein
MNWTLPHRSSLGWRRYTHKRKLAGYGDRDGGILAVLGCVEQGIFLTNHRGTENTQKRGKRR